MLNTQNNAAVLQRSQEVERNVNTMPQRAGDCPPTRSCDPGTRIVGSDLGVFISLTFSRTGWSRVISDKYLKSVTKLSKQCLPSHKGMAMLRRPRIGPNSHFQYWSKLKRSIYKFSKQSGG